MSSWARRCMLKLSYPRPRRGFCFASSIAYRAATGRGEVRPRPRNRTSRERPSSRPGDPSSRAGEAAVRARSRAAPRTWRPRSRAPARRRVPGTGAGGAAPRPAGRGPRESGEQDETREPRGAGAREKEARGAQRDETGDRHAPEPPGLPQLEQDEGQRQAHEAGEPARVSEGGLQTPVLRAVEEMREVVGREREDAQEVQEPQDDGHQGRARDPPEEAPVESSRVRLARQQGGEQEKQPQPVDGSDRVERVLRERAQDRPREVVPLEEEAVLDHRGGQEQERERRDERVGGEERQDEAPAARRRRPLSPGPAEQQDEGERRHQQLEGLVREPVGVEAVEEERGAEEGESRARAGRAGRGRARRRGGRARTKTSPARAPSA